MAKKYPGLYLYFDWMKGLEQLPPEVAMKIICNLYHYAEEGREPEPLEGYFGILQNVFVAQISRSKTMSELGKTGGAERQKNLNRKTLPIMPMSMPAYEEEDLEPDEEADLRDKERLYNAMMKGISALEKPASFPFDKR